MTTNKKVDVLHLAFVVGIMILVINLVVEFSLIDLIYVLFLTICYIRLLLIRKKGRKKVRKV